jgi:ubiquinone/menaquinone biosynthesis C-methylase UbiE
VTGPGAPASGLEGATSYDGVALAFDRLSDRFSAPLARRLLDAVEVGPGDHVLDVGTGTGLVAFPAAARVGAEGTVLGVDISEEMLATAREKTGRMLEPGHVAFRIMDAQALTLPDASFDVVVSLFAIHHLPDPAAAVREMHRVVRPGGRLAVAVGSGPPLLSSAAARRAVGRAGELWRRLRGLELAAPAFLERLARRRWPASDTHHATHSPGSVNLPRLVRTAGFTDVRTFWEGHATVLESPEEFWDIQRTYSTLVRERLARASADEVGDLRDAVLKVGRRVLEHGGRLTYRHAALFVTARRPAASHG